jgi:ABC-type multidrug transport system fused ATPase/permease subunit
MTLSRQVWQLLDASQRRALLRLLAIALITGVSTLIGVAAIVPFLALLADPQHMADHTVIRWAQSVSGVSGFRPTLWLSGAAFVLALTLSNVVTLFGIAATERHAQSIAAGLQHTLFEEYLRRELAFHVATDSAALSVNILHEVQRFTSGVIYNGLLSIGSGFASFLIIGSIVLMNPVIGGLAVLSLGGMYLLIFTLVRRRLAASGQLITREWEQRSRLVAESLGAIKEILLLRNQPYFGEQFRRHARLIGEALAGTATLAQSPRYILECFTAAGLVAAALWASATQSSNAWVVQLSFLAMATYRLLPSLQQVFGSLARVRANRSALDKIGHDLACARATAARLARSAETPPPPRGARESIRLRDVTFHYVPGRPAALQALNLDIAAGSFVAFVGPNGSGKTTLADMLLGLLRPQRGTVEVDGVALDEHNLAAWQMASAYVPQTPFLLNAGLTQNIALGTPHETIDFARLHEAVQHAQLGSLVASLPRGLDEPLGERGNRLSGGQRQRVGIARALYRQPSLLVLDEATSALDGGAERELVELLRGLAGERTIILIAHRLASVRHCDRIFELDRGVVINSGNAAELCRASERFRRLSGFAA